MLINEIVEQSGDLAVRQHPTFAHPHKLIRGVSIVYASELAERVEFGPFRRTKLFVKGQDVSFHDLEAFQSLSIGIFVAVQPWPLAE